MSDLICTKIKYRTKARAISELKIKIAAGTQTSLATVYPCDRCDYNFFHITSGLTKLQKENRFDACHS